MSSGLQQNYGFSSKNVGFFDLFANPPRDLKERAMEIVEIELAQGISATKIKRSARLLQEYELMFWDTMQGNG
jgi:hypothetical protein